MGYQPIENYGIIGNMRTAALVGMNGSIDWYCSPHFDSPSVFGAILDDEKGGRFKIVPVAERVKSRQFYWPSTNILVTRFLHEDGITELEDFMPVGLPPESKWYHHLYRRIRCVRGTVKIRMVCRPAFEYGRAEHQVKLHPHGATFVAGTQNLHLCSGACIWAYTSRTAARPPHSKVCYITFMGFRKIEKDGLECTTSVARPFGCMELWAGNERAHRSLELAGLETDVIAVPSGADKGGDLSAVFSCSDNIARVVLADCVGHGYVASSVARHVHRLLHKFQDIRDTAGLLGALNDEFTLSNEKAEGPLRLTTVVTGTYDGTTGEFNFAYAAHPRMLLWRTREERFLELGQGLEGFPLGFITGETYNQQSVRLGAGDMILAFSDGATEVHSPEGEQLSAKGLLELAGTTLAQLPQPAVLRDFSVKLLDGIQRYRASADFEDDITLLTLRRSA